MTHCNTPRSELQFKGINKISHIMGQIICKKIYDIEKKEEQLFEENKNFIFYSNIQILVATTLLNSNLNIIKMCDQ